MIKFIIKSSSSSKLSKSYDFVSHHTVSSLAVNHVLFRRKNLSFTSKLASQSLIFRSASQSLIFFVYITSLLLSLFFLLLFFFSSYHFIRQTTLRYFAFFVVLLCFCCLSFAVLHQILEWLQSDYFISFLKLLFLRISTSHRSNL